MRKKKCDHDYIDYCEKVVPGLVQKCWKCHHQVINKDKLRAVFCMLAYMFDQPKSKGE